MKEDEEIEALRRFVLERELPKTETALFGVKCPYCGKADRVRRLERPMELRDELSPEDLSAYSDLWEGLARPGKELGVCQFCRNPVVFLEGGGEGEVVESKGEKR